MVPSKYLKCIPNFFYILFYIFLCFESCALFVDINECESDPCMNGAACDDHVNGYSCDCGYGYMGIHCETGM